MSLRVENATLRIASDDGTVDAAWPLDRVRRIAMPDPNAITLSFGDGDARLIVARDAVPPELRGSARGAGRLVAVMAVVAGLCLLGAIALVAVAPARLAPLVPDAWQAWVGFAIEEQLTRGHTACASPAGVAALEGLSARLARGAGLASPAHVAVADDGTINALTLPGDRIVMLRGLIDAAADGDEVAGVLAHEYGHVARRDPLAGLIRQAGMTVGALLLGLGDAGTLASVARHAVTLSFSRTAERDADARALVTLRAAGLRADGLGRFFAAMRKREAVTLPQWLSTHPATEDREAAARAGDDGDHAFTDDEWRAVRAICVGQRK